MWNSLWGSRCSTRVSEAFASAVSMLITVCASSLACGCGFARQLQHFLHVFDVSLPDLYGLGVGLGVVVAIGKAEPSGAVRKAITRVESAKSWLEPKPNSIWYPAVVRWVRARNAG